MQWSTNGKSTLVFPMPVAFLRLRPTYPLGGSCLARQPRAASNSLIDRMPSNLQSGNFGSFGHPYLTTYFRFDHDESIRTERMLSHDNRLSREKRTRLYSSYDGTVCLYPPPSNWVRSCFRITAIRDPQGFRHPRWYRAAVPCTKRSKRMVPASVFVGYRTAAPRACPTWISSRFGTG